MDIKIAPKVINVHLSAVRLFFCALVSTLPLTTTPDCAGAPSVAAYIKVTYKPEGDVLTIEKKVTKHHQ